MVAALPRTKITETLQIRFQIKIFPRTFPASFSHEKLALWWVFLQVFAKRGGKQGLVLRVSFIVRASRPIFDNRKRFKFAFKLKFFLCVSRKFFSRKTRALVGLLAGVHKTRRQAGPRFASQFYCPRFASNL